MAPDRYHHIFEVLGRNPLLNGLPVSLSVGAVVLLGVINILQQIPPAQDIPYEHIGLEGALVAAVVVLWRALAVKDAQIAAKDAQITLSAKVTTEALAASAASNIELRRIIEHLGDSLTRERAQLRVQP